MLAFSRHGETVGERGECPLLLGLGFLPLSLGVSFAWYGLYKNEKCICPYLRLTAETKIAIPVGMSLGFKPPAFNSFLFILRK